MPGRDVIAIGASAGGVEALRDVVAGLPADLDAAVFVVLHVPPTGSSALPAILQRSGHLPVVHAVDGQAVEAGRVYVAPPDYHMLVFDGVIRLRKGPRENGHRPAVDPLFRSLAHSFGPRAIGVVLSGALDDGAAGLATIAAFHGKTVVQDPDDALYDGMPRAALGHVRVDAVVPARDLPEVLCKLVKEEVDDRRLSTPPEMEMELRMATFDGDALADPDRPGTPAGFTCPDCHGVLYEITGDPVVRYRCRVGHAWSAESLLAEQEASIEGALWMALRALEEKTALYRRLSQAAGERGHLHTRAAYDERGEDISESVEVLRRLLLSRHPEAETQQQSAG